MGKHKYGFGKMFSGVKIWNEMTQEERKALLKDCHAKAKKEVISNSSCVPLPLCHKGNILAFVDPVSEVKFYGGGWAKNCDLWPGMGVIDLANNFPPIVKISGFDMPLTSNFSCSYRIAIEWKDYSAPKELTKEFWLALVRELRENLVRLNLKNMLVCCQGGHGRTGSCLSILAGLMGATATDPVAFIRENYCKKAVESNSQLDYIEEVTGIEVKAEPAKGYAGLANYQSQGMQIYEGM